MNLAATVELFAGGMGSGCRGPNCGRKSGGKASPDRVFRVLRPAVRKDIREGGVRFVKVPIANLRGLPTYMGHSLQTLRDVDPDAVNRRAEKMVNGKGFKPIVLWQSGDRFHIQDGMHRLAAFRKVFPKETKIRALVLTEKGKKDNRLYKAISERMAEGEG